MVFGLSSRSRSSSAASWSNVESFCAYEFIPQLGTERRIWPDDMRFNILSASVSMALDILQSPQGFSALRRLASETLRSTTYPQRRSEDPGLCANDFLRRVNDALPVIFIHDLGDINGRTSREPWNRPPGRSFVAQHAAVIEINTRLLGFAISARDAFDRHATVDTKLNQSTNIFRLGVTIAHELCHVFTGYLLFDHTAMTPPRVTYGASYTNLDYGEAGRFWESRLFGGLMDMRGDGNLGSDNNYAAIKDAAKRYAYIIRSTAILQLIDRNFTNLPYVEEGAFNGELVSRKSAYHWDSNYRDLFDGCPGEPPKLPRELRARFTYMGRDTVLQHIIIGSDIRRWMNRPRSSLRATERAVLNT